VWSIGSRDDGGDRIVDDVGSVQRPPSPTSSSSTSPGTREQQHPGGGGDFEYRDRLAGIGALAFFQRGGEFGVGDKLRPAESVR